MKVLPPCYRQVLIVMDLVAYDSSPSMLPPSVCSDNPCAFLCIPKNGTFMCECPTHYTLTDNSSCSGPKSFILFSQKNKISRLLLAPHHAPDIVLPIKRARSIQAISYDQVEDMIYWVDHGRGEQPARQAIRRARDTGLTDRLQMFDRFLPFDLAIDPTTRSLFWSCA